jgi:hypothetical protein
MRYVKSISVTDARQPHSSQQLSFRVALTVDDKDSRYKAKSLLFHKLKLILRPTQQQVEIVLPKTMIFVRGNPKRLPQTLLSCDPQRQHFQ